MRSSILKRVASLLPVLHLPLLSQLITSPRTLSPHPSPWRNHLRQPTGNSAARRAASCRAKTPARRSSRVISVRKFEFFLPIAVLAAARYCGAAITYSLLSPKTKEPGVRENHSCRTTSTTIFLIYFNQFYRISLDGGGGELLRSTGKNSGLRYNSVVTLRFLLWNKCEVVECLRVFVFDL